MSFQARSAFPEAFVRPPKACLGKKGPLSPDQVAQFFDKGYLVVPNVIDHDLIARLKDEWSQKVNQLVEELYAAGKIKNKHEDKDLFTRMIHIDQEYPGATVVLHRRGELGPVAMELWSYPKLLDALEQLLGPDIVGHPVWNIRCCLPNYDQTLTPWHQDNGYFSDDAGGTMIATAWIPFHDVDMTNGGLQVIQKSHQKGVLADHTCCARNTWYIEVDPEVVQDTLGCDMVSDKVDCNVPKGGALLFNNLVVHASVPNVSDKIRWSMDLRWQDPSKPNGREGLETVDQMPVMRSSSKKIEKIDWSVLVNRQENDKTSSRDEAPGPKMADPFDTTLSGPWMLRWPLVHKNKHTAAAGL